jgi:hypothetical protein
VDAIAGACAKLALDQADAARGQLVKHYPFAPVPKVKRQYTPDQALSVFVRDGFVDRYTGGRLIFPPVLHVVHDLLPDVFPHHPAWKMTETHRAFDDLSATVDHVKPVAGGGADDPSNWVTTSMAVNFAKNNATLPGLQWSLHPPGRFEDWDGLLHWFVDYVGSNGPRHTRSAIRRWIAPAKRALAAR